MNRREFLEQLRKGLLGLPQEEVEECLRFYGEMITDRMEEGLSEEEAITEIGSVDDIITQTIAEISPSKLVKKRLGVWAIVLIVLGSPIWLSLLISVFAVILSIYVTLWSVVISLWAVELSLWASALGGITGGILFFVTGYPISGAALFGVGIVCAGISIFFFYGCKYATKAIIWLTKKIAKRRKDK